MSLVPPIFAAAPIGSADNTSLTKRHSAPGEHGSRVFPIAIYSKNFELGFHLGPLLVTAFDKAGDSACLELNP